MAISIAIPNFRKPSRLIRWMGVECIRERLSSDREQVFFKEYEKNPERAAGSVVSYSSYVGPLPEMEHMLKGHGKHIVQYAKNIRHHGRTLPDDIRDTIEDESWLVQWSREFGRLPPHLENRITNPEHAFRYSQVVNTRLPEDMENRVFVGRQSADALLRYIRHHNFIANESQRECLKASKDNALAYIQYLFAKKAEVPVDIRDSLMGDDQCLYGFSQLHGRLPEHLESSMTKPEVLLDYAVNVLRGRLPEALEAHMETDHRSAINYAFKVIRGYAPCRLPEAIHASIVLKSFECNDSDIRRYIAACDSDPNRTGNK